MRSGYLLGIDQHKRQSRVHIREPNGRSVGSFSVRHDRLEPFRERLQALDGPIEAALEATGFYWWMVRELRSQGVAVRLAHPTGLRLIFQSKNKTDSNDAERLSKLLWLGALPESYVPSDAHAQMRELAGTRRILVKTRTQLVNRIHQLYSKLNEPLPFEEPCIPRRTSYSFPKPH